MIIKVISGGQTGADRAGLVTAKKLGIQTGGWMPKGFLAQDGNHPEFAELYGIKEHESEKYPPRTALNVKGSDGTIRIARNWESAGERLTFKMIRQYKKPFIDVPFLRPGDGVPKTVGEVIDWLKFWKIKIVNIAGNSESAAPGIFKYACAFLEDVFLLDSHGV